MGCMLAERAGSVKGEGRALDRITGLAGFGRNPKSCPSFNPENPGSDNGQSFNPGSGLA